ncbi:hypothetical protein LTR62_005903 [Meristemomyces frigidus]|uniref:Haloacid dehalogenase n=1 Tax=Meristemomyces frigidus TaxID=1508187 RepID=A0AAN7TVX9_9PEZI|nr:hypothetical protein LTR62_005903 [Meristemomyces frigidus]
MSSVPPLRVLFLDVFGTTVAQIPPVADELCRAAKEALDSKTSSISGQVRSKAMQMSCDQWVDLVINWNRSEEEFVHDSKAKHGNVDWKEVDRRRISSLQVLLANRGLIVLRLKPGTSELSVEEEGSLWNEFQLAHLGRIWHRLPPWPDTCRGLEMLNTRFTTVGLSNTYQELLNSLVDDSNIPFKHVCSSEMFNSYKPNPKVYLGAAEKLGVKPEDCALVAAHLGDLKGAKACGLYAIYVERPLEEKDPELREEKIPDLHVGEDEGGLVALAERLGIRSD